MCHSQATCNKYRKLYLCRLCARLGSAESLLLPELAGKRKDQRLHGLITLAIWVLEKIVGFEHQEIKVDHNQNSMRISLPMVLTSLFGIPET